MAQQIHIITGQVKLTAQLNDSPSAKALVKALPMQLSMSRWGDEYYGECGLDVKEEPQARTLMEVGELAIWPPGSALCIFFGPTPASTADDPIAASKVNPVGRVTSQIEPLKELGSSIKVRVELAKSLQG